MFSRLSLLHLICACNREKMLLSVVHWICMIMLPNINRIKFQTPSRIQIQELSVMLGNRTQKKEQKRRVINVSHQNCKIRMPLLRKILLNNFTTIVCNAKQIWINFFTVRELHREICIDFDICERSQPWPRFTVKVLTSKTINLAVLAAYLTKFPGCYGDHPDSSTGLIRALTLPMTG